MQKPEGTAPGTQLCQEEQGEQVKPSPASFLEHLSSPGREVEAGRVERCATADLGSFEGKPLWWSALWWSLLCAWRGHNNIHRQSRRLGWARAVSSAAQQLHSMLEALVPSPGPSALDWGAVSSLQQATLSGRKVPGPGLRRFFLIRLYLF